MIKVQTPDSSIDERLRALLTRYRCPVPFHELRSRFLGNIATPNLSASPMRAIEALWDGKLPEFDSIEAANELIGALIGGLWNGLTAHQHRSSPFRLTRTQTAATRESLVALAVMRRQELDGLIEGLFGKEKVVEFPQRAHRALDELGRIRALFAAVADVAGDESKPGAIKDIETTHRHLRQMTRNAEHEITAIVIACRIARKHMLTDSPTTKPTVH